MHIVIDRQKLKFLPIKHESIHVIGDLVWIEAPQAHVHVMPLGYNFLSDYTDLELMLLYKNTTGEKPTKVGDQLRNLLEEIAERIPVREVNPFELSKQADLVPEKTGSRYLYDKGKFKPQKMNDLFVLDPVQMPRSENESLIAARPRVRPQGPRAPAANTTAAPAPAPRPARAQRGPRQGGVRELVWAVADKMWEAAGKPKETSTVLALRKTMMNVLESDHNVKRTSSSNELGQWQKARI